jgi:gluconate 2-dehydrogenase gamma chain
VVVGAATLIPVSALIASAQNAKNVLGAGDRRILEAFVDRLIPRDEHGPSATECGVAIYIDRALGDFLSAEKPVITQGLAATDAFARKTYASGFTALPPEKQDEVLTALENNSAAGFHPDSRTFFQRLRQLAMEGMFGDPFYGGNRAFAGWELIRYPGPKLAVGPDDQKINVELKPNRRSAYGEDHGH